MNRKDRKGLTFSNRVPTETKYLSSELPLCISCFCVTIVSTCNPVRLERSGRLEKDRKTEIRGQHEKPINQ